MSRALAALPLALLLVGGGASSRAEPTTVTAEGGGEVDTNVQRVETGAGLDTARIAAPVGRLGARVAHRGRLRGGGVAVGASALTRYVLDPTVRSENIALLAADVRYQRALGRRGVSAGIALNAADAIPFDDDLGARTFRNLAADAVLVMRPTDERSLSIAAGARAFEYKPDRDYSYAGPALTARLDLMLWQPSGGARSVELSLGLGFESRAYESTALASACPDDAEPSPMCFAPTTRLRSDRYQRANVDLTWVGRAVTAIGYQLAVIDSNSYGQSIVRHRAMASITMDLPWRLYGTVLAILQIDQYLDGLVVQKDLLQQQFTSLDDENRSSFQVRLARQVTDAWSIEGRVALWRDLGDATESEFARELAYIGAVYSR